MPINIFSQIARMRKKTEVRLATYEQNRGTFFLLITLSSAIATIGLLLNNTAIIIGAMVVAPLITPIFGFSLSLITSNVRRIYRTAFLLISGSTFGFCVTIITTALVFLIDPNTVTLTAEISSRAVPNILFFFIALLSGIAGAYAYAKPDVLASVAGIAIAVALIPPLCVSGISVFLRNLELLQGSISLYGLNLLGICLGSIMLFLYIGFGKDT